MRRIAMVVYSSPNDTRVCRAARALRSEGDNVDLFCLPDPIVQTQANFTHIYTAPIPKYQEYSPLFYILSYIEFFTWSFWKLSCHFLKKRYSLIHIHSMPDFLAFTALLPKLFGKRVILDIHDSMPDIYMSKFRLPERHWFIRILRFQEVVSAKFADKVIAVHELHKQLLIKHGVSPRKIEIIMNLPDDHLFHSRKDTPKNARFTIVYHGTITHRLGLDIALRAINLLRPKIPNLIFRIIGAGEKLTDLTDLVNDLNLGDNVCFKSRVPYHKVQSAIEDADLAIIPNRKDSATDLMLPVKLLEYVFVGIPCIAPLTAAIRYYFDENMIQFFQPEDVEDLAEKILKLYKDPQRRKEMVVQARRFCDRYNWKTHKIGYLKLIDGLTT